MPSTFVELSRRPGYCDSNYTSDEVRWASQNKSNSPVETKSLDDSWEEVLEPVGSKMHVCHESENPDHGVLSSLTETSPHRGLSLVANGIEGHAVGG